MDMLHMWLFHSVPATQVETLGALGGFGGA